MKTLAAVFNRLPFAWLAFGTGLLLFVFTRMAPGADWSLPPTSQSLLDRAYIGQLQDNLLSYSLLEDHQRQTYGPHVLPQYARSLLARLVGDADRAGIWLSLVGVLGALSGVYALSRRILPLRGYCLICLVALAAVGTIHYAVRPDPSIALGMGLILWGFAFFTSALIREMPRRVLLAAVFFGLAGYIHFELSLIQLLLSLYLIGLSLVSKSTERHPLPYAAMAVGGIVVVGLLLWPLIHMNMVIAGTPILPGPGAEMVLGVAPPPGGGGFPFLERFLMGFRVLMYDPAGPGIFAGLLWPLGMAISLWTGKDKAIPLFWLPMLVTTVLLLTLMSFVTGVASYRESLQIITPILLPFSVLPVVFLVFRWFQAKPRDSVMGLKVWVVTAIGVVLMVQVPHAMRALLNRTPESDLGSTEWVDAYAALSAEELALPVLTDLPAVLLAADKEEVYGLGGETDFNVHNTKYADGTLNPGPLLDYLEKHRIGMIHVSSIEAQPPLEQARLLLESPDRPEDTSIVALEPLMGRFPPPHSVYRVRYASGEAL